VTRGRKRTYTKPPAQPEQGSTSKASRTTGTKRKGSEIDEQLPCHSLRRNTIDSLINALNNEEMSLEDIEFLATELSVEDFTMRSDLDKCEKLFVLAKTKCSTEIIQKVQQVASRKKIKPSSDADKIDAVLKNINEAKAKRKENGEKINKILYSMEGDDDLTEKEQRLLDLLKQGADDTEEVLHLFSKMGNSEVVNSLIQVGTDPNIQNEKGKTPLHHAAKMGKIDVLKVLLVAGADPNIKDEKGKTPLYYAAAKGDADTVGLLLEAGASPHVKDKNNQTALDLALESGHGLIVSTFLQRLVDPRLQVHEGLLDTLGKGHSHAHAPPWGSYPLWYVSVFKF